ncbi:MAG: flagellar hook capping FlgD N-terminal domain-containing protein [Pseudomonadota bacterium]
MQVAPIPGQPVNSTPPQNVETDNDASAATDAFGLSFESLLQIILTQLTFQDPLEPLDNFEFVSQLAQFSQIQQTQNLNDKFDTLLATQSILQATSLLGQIVDIPAGQSALSGTVTGVSFNSGAPRVTIETADGQTISNIGLAAISQVRQGE